MSELAALSRRLDREGYAHLISFSGPTFLDILDFRVEKDAGPFGRWRVFDTERGQITQTYLETDDEAEACAYWYERVSNTMWFLTGWPDAVLAERAEAELASHGIASLRNDLPDHTSRKDTRFRIFVAGRNLLRGATIVATLA